MDFFGLGISELFFIVMFCLIFFKPEEIPAIVRAIVQHIKKFRSVSSKIKQDIGDIYHREIESKFEEVKEELENVSYQTRETIQDEYKKMNSQMTKTKKEMKESIDYSASKQEDYTKLDSLNQVKGDDKHEESVASEPLKVKSTLAEDNK